VEKGRQGEREEGRKARKETRVGGCRDWKEIVR